MTGLTRWSVRCGIRDPATVCHPCPHLKKPVPRETLIRHPLMPRHVHPVHGCIGWRRSRMGLALRDTRDQYSYEPVWFNMIYQQR